MNGCVYAQNSGLAGRLANRRPDALSLLIRIEDQIEDKEILPGALGDRHSDYIRHFGSVFADGGGDKSAEIHALRIKLDAASQLGLARKVIVDSLHRHR